MHTRPNSTITKICSQLLLCFLIFTSFLPTLQAVGTIVAKEPLKIKTLTKEEAAALDGFKKGHQYSEVCEKIYTDLQKEPMVIPNDNKNKITYCECKKLYTKRFPKDLSEPAKLTGFCQNYKDLYDGDFCIINQSDFADITVETTKEKFNAKTGLDAKQKLELYNSKCEISKEAVCSIEKTQIKEFCHTHLGDPTYQITKPTGIGKCINFNPNKLRCDSSTNKVIKIESTFDTESFDLSNLKADGQGQSFFKSQNETGTLISAINRVIDFLVGIASIVALVIFIIGTITLITSTGNSEQVEKGTAMIKYSIFGLLIILLSYFAVISVQSIFF